MPEETHHTEQQLRDLARQSAPLRPEMRNRVLSQCAAAGHNAKLQRSRANRRLAYGFAAFCVFYWSANGALTAQRTALVGNSDSQPHLVASAPPEQTPQQRHEMRLARAQLRLLLSNPDFIELR